MFSKWLFPVVVSLVFFPCYFTSAAPAFVTWEIDTIASDTMEPGSFGQTFRVPLPVDSSGDINFGLLRVDVNQTTDGRLNEGRSMLYLSTSESHHAAGIGPAWPVSHYKWAISASGIVRITRCETDPLTEQDFVAQNKQTGVSPKQHSSGIAGNSGYLVEETMSTTAFCLPTPLSDVPLSQRTSNAARSKDAPNADCQCLGESPGESPTTKYLYARARCYGKPGTTSGCSFTATVSVTCPSGTAPSATGECRLCEVDQERQNAASVVVTVIGSGNTIASAQCLAEMTCPAGTSFIADGITRDALENSYIPKSSKNTPSQGERRLSSVAEVGRCEPCSQPFFSVANATSCDYTLTTCPAGTYAEWLTQSCVSCTVGRYSDIAGATSADVCIPCGKGKFLAFEGGTNSQMCLGCPQDTYNELSAAGDCKTCPVGKMTLRQKSTTADATGNATTIASNRAQQAAEDKPAKILVTPDGRPFPLKDCERACREQAPCEAGEETNKCCKSFALDKNTGKACGITPCPLDAICEENVDIAPGIKSCRNSKFFFKGDCFGTCPAGYTGIAMNDTHVCEEAHNATSVDGGEYSCKELCKLGEHYTESGGAPACIPCEGGAEWCIGTMDCLGNRTSDGCIQCLDGFYEVRRVCTECPENAVASLLIVVLVLIVVLGVVFIFAGSSRPETSLSGLMIFLGHIQIQGYLLRFNVNWPPEFVWFMRLLSSIFTLDIPALVPAPECSFKWGTETQYLTSMASLPILIMLCWIPVIFASIYTTLCHCRGMICCRKKKNKKKCSAIERSFTHKAIAVSTLIFSVMYGFISPASTELGLCSQRAGDTSTIDIKTYLNSDPSVECQARHFLLATFFGVLYSLGIPVCIVVFLWWGRNKKLLWDEENWIPDHVGWIYLRFEHSVFWWELVNMVTKTFIGVTERAGAGGSRDGNEDQVARWTVQIVLTFVCLTASLALQLYFRPYASMLERADIVHEPYTFTIRGGKRSHGVHLEAHGTELERGCVVTSVNEDAKFVPVCDDEFQETSKDHVVGHSMRMGDIITHIDGKLLPHVFAHARRKTLAQVLHLSKAVGGSIEKQVSFNCFLQQQVLAGCFFLTQFFYVFFLLSLFPLIFSWMRRLKGKSKLYVSILPPFTLTLMLVALTVAAFKSTENFAITVPPMDRS